MQALPGTPCILSEACKSHKVTQTPKRGKHKRAKTKKMCTMTQRNLLKSWWFYIIYSISKEVLCVVYYIICILAKYSSEMLKKGISECWSSTHNGFYKMTKEHIFKILGSENLIKQDKKSTNLFYKWKEKGDINLTTLKLSTLGKKKQSGWFYAVTCPKTSYKSMWRMKLNPHYNCQVRKPCVICTKIPCVLSGIYFFDQKMP